jgi:ankyrin repeat protein
VFFAYKALNMDKEFYAIWRQITDACENGTLESLSREVLTSDVRTEYGYTLLHNACDRDENDRVEIVKVILDSGVDVNPVLEDGDTPLHIACIFEHTEVVEMLVEYGADINKKNNNGNTPLHTSDHNPEITKLLLDKGADIYTKNKCGTIPLFTALHWGNNSTIKLLKEAHEHEHQEIMKLKEDYIKLKDDETIKPEIQEMMIAAAITMKNVVDG